MTSEEHALSFRDLEERGVRFSRKHLRTLIRAGKFPAPFQLSEHRTAWLASEIDDWLAQRSAMPAQPHNGNGRTPASRLTDTLTRAGQQLYQAAGHARDPRQSNAILNMAASVMQLVREVDGTNGHAPNGHAPAAADAVHASADRAAPIGPGIVRRRLAPAAAEFRSGPELIARRQLAIEN